ncbi:MAG: diphthine--ammonia ligase [Candidatus Omnitrophota bacterium]
MKAVSLWSGGKDSCFACYKAMSRGYKVTALFNFTKLDGTASLSHGLDPRLISDQARVCGLPLFQKPMPGPELYEREFKNLIAEWKVNKGIEAIIFGDIYLKEHKEWIDRVCKESDIKPVFPLWGLNTKDILCDFINCGFKAVIVCVKAGVLGEEWLGRELDKRFIEDLRRYDPAIDPCGEEGEFHTFVYDGPIFKRPVEFRLLQQVILPDR